MKYIDTHAHYNDEAFNENLDEVLKKCTDANIRYIINVGYNKESSIKTIILSSKYNQIYSAIGIHPQYVAKNNIQNIYEIYKCFDSSKIVAIGEIGLDYAFVRDNKEAQKSLFESQIELANTLKLPVIIHSRDASLDTYNIIKSNKPQYGTLFHCFQPSEELVSLVLDNKYMVAFGGNITYKRNELFKSYVEKIPLNQIVIETDSPYLAPVPYRGTTNTSVNLSIICKKLAEYKNITEEEMAKIVYENSINFFNIKNKD